MINGNTDGVRDSLLKELDTLYDLEPQADIFLPDEIISALVKHTMVINREISLYISRSGEIFDITIGSIESVPLTERHLRRHRDRLAGVRCIHSHPGGDSMISAVDRQALRAMRFDAMVAIGVKDGHCTGVTASFLGEADDAGKRSVSIFGPVDRRAIPNDDWLNEIQISESLVRGDAIYDTADRPERCILVGLDTEDALNELQALVESAGAVTIARECQKRAKPDSTTYIGSGKVEELALTCQALDADAIVCDDELSGAQVRTLENALGVKVLDRTAVILDIFAQRAQSREGKMQVELAQLKYKLPRLTGKGTLLSRLGGGIGTRGPGESQLETDRRHIRNRIQTLKESLNELAAQRTQRRKRREKNSVPVAALVGYTNAGKSTLLNALSGADAFVMDQVFATLDPLVRRMALPDNGECLLVDTVGFIRKLPHDIVEAFKSTLEEALNADLLIIVSDASSPEYDAQLSVVKSVLTQLNAEGIPTLEVLNKSDLVEYPPEPKDALSISAVNGAGLSTLKQLMAAKFNTLRQAISLIIPYDKGQALSLIHDNAQRVEVEYVDEGTRVNCLADAALIGQLSRILGKDIIRSEGSEDNT